MDQLGLLLKDRDTRSRIHKLHRLTHHITISALKASE